MGNLMVSLLNAGNTLEIFEQGMSVVQNNVANMNTPGYARQRLLLQADRFQPELGLPGGVSSPGISDSRSAYAERNIRRQIEQQSRNDARVRHLALIEPLFDISANSGISGAVDRLFQSFSALTAAPNDTAARQVALDRAADLARTFNRAGASLSAATREVETEIQTSVDQLNSIGEDLRLLNSEFRQDFRARSDAGLNSRLNTLLEKLATLADASVLRQDDGSVIVALAGQSQFVVGDHLYPVSADISGASARIVDSLGEDITARLNGGSLAGLLELRNQLLPAWSGNLDRLASELATRVNTTLAQGLDLNGQTPIRDLFSFDAAAGAAYTLAVVPLDPSELALAEAGSPGGNGNALALTAIGRERTIDGYTFNAFYGAIAAQAGRALATGREDLHNNDLLLSQAQTWRDEISRVNPDEEAIVLLQYQRAYQATAQLIAVLDELTETMINIIR
jgi:flagellar hook-associated protein 1 FlgK